MRKWHTLVPMLLCSLQLFAQWGGRTIYEFKSYTGRQTDPYTPDISPLGVQIGIGAGVDLDASDRTSIGLEFVYDIQLSRSDGNYTSFRSRNGLVGNGNTKDRSYTILYRSMFCASSNLDGHFYFGPEIGIRRFTREYSDISGGDNFSGPSYSAADLGLKPVEKGRVLLFPVGLRLGFRSGMNGSYWDWYTGVGTQFGRTNEVVDGIKPVDPNESFFKPVAWHLGFAWGFGS